MNRVRSLGTILKDTASEWMANNALRLSAALAYYSIFSIAPLLIVSMGLCGLFFGQDAMQGHLDDQIKDLVGAQAAETIQTLVKSASQPTKSLTATIVGLATLLLGASGVFAQLKDALNTIWGVKGRSGLGWRAFVRERLLSFGMVLVIGFLLLTSFVLTALLSAFSDWIDRVLQLPDWIWGGAAMLVSMLVITLLFALMFKVLPDVEIDWRHVWIGAAATALLFEIGKFGLAVYLGRESTASSFGAAGSVVLLLLWIYYSSCILLFGAEFTKVYALADGVKLAPSKLAELVTPEVRAKEGMEPVATEAPPKESLASVFSLPTPPEGETLPSEEPFPGKVREHMAAGLLGAVGCGLALGFASRLLEREKELKPGEQMRASVKILGATGALLLTRAGRSWAHRATTSIGKALPLRKIFDRVRCALSQEAP